MRKGRGSGMVLLVLCVTAAACTSQKKAEPPAPTPSATASATGSPAPSPTPTGGRSFTVVASGDILVHPGVWTRAQRDAAAQGKGRAYDFAPMLSDVRPHVENADLAICHMEVSLGRQGATPAGFPLFSAPPEVADSMARLGYDSCSTASNHALDRGEEGIGRTIAAFDAAGVRHAGTARSQSEHDIPTILEVDGVRVAHLSYTYGHNNARPKDKPWLINVLADGSIVPDARAARAAGAQVVIVSVHWGTEFDQRPTAQQLEVAQEVMDSGEVDLVLGHHAHVVQPIQRYGDRFVVFGMGNVIAAGSHNFGGGASREGILPEFRFTEGAEGRWRVTRILVTPLYVETLGGLHATDVASALVAPAPGEDVARLRQARERTAAVVYSLGVPDDVVVVR